MLNTIFNDNDIVEVRCLHKDQKVNDRGFYEPEPHMYWGKVPEVKKLFNQLKDLNKKGYNVYFGANPRPEKKLKFSTKANCLFVDLDHCSIETAEEQLEKVQADWMVPDPSLCVSSGNGVHFYWKLKNPIEIKTFTEGQKALIHTFALYGDVVDKAIHDGPRIMRLPGFSNHKGGNVATVISKNENVCEYSDFLFCVPNIPVVKVAEYDPNYQGQNENALERALKYFEKRDGAGKGNRNNEAFKIAAACLNDFGLSESDAYHVISTWNQKNSPLLSENEVKTVLTKAQKYIGNNVTCSKDRPMTKTNHSNYDAGPDAFVPNAEETVPAESNFVNETDKIVDKASENTKHVEPEITNKTANIDFQVLAKMVDNYVLVAGTTDVWDLENGILMPIAALAALYPKEIKFWKTDFDRKVVLSKNLVFEPSGKVKPGQINTFQGFQFKQDDRPCDKLIAHLEMLCGNDTQVFEWVLSWCALQVQNPGTKIASSIIMHGKQGTGKSMFWECFGKIFDPYSIKINQTLLESDFNAWSSRKTFVLCEEVLANKSKSRLKNVIKDMVTGGSVQINQKFSRPWAEKCYMNMVFLSNNKLPMILDEDDRRFMVIKTDLVEGEQYYSDLAAEIEDNGPARFYNFLLNWNLNGFHAHTKPLITDAKSDLINLTKPSAKVFLDALLSDEIEELPIASASRSDLYDAYATYCKASGYRSTTRNLFHRIIVEDYHEITPRRSGNNKFYMLPGGSSVTHPFNDALLKYINKIYNRRV